MHDCLDEHICGQKAAQVAYTEFSMNRTLHALDMGIDVLYVLPSSRPLASDFSTGRLDPAIEESPELSVMFKSSKNVGMKVMGGSTLYIRGANSRAGLKGLPVGLLVMDELDEMTKESILLARERLSGQKVRRMLDLSTPSLPDHGINKIFEDSSQDHFRFPCPSCNKWIEMKFPESVVVVGDDERSPEVKQSYYICTECKVKLDYHRKREAMQKGKWFSEIAGRNIRGFYVNQLYSNAFYADYIAEAYLRSLKDPSAEQEFYNSKLGLPHVVADAKITDEMVTSCIGSYKSHDFARDGLITMGVDQGNTMYVEICRWHVDTTAGFDVNTYARCQVIKQMTLVGNDAFAQLDGLMHRYAVRFCVIDAQPERRPALAFANRWNGRVKLCYYPVGMNNRSIMVSQEEEHTIKVDRTSWLDMSLGRFRNGTIALPLDVSLDYKDQVTAQVRVPGFDQYGNPVNRYKTPGDRHDHYGHARNYAEIALPFALGMGVVQDIRR